MNTKQTLGTFEYEHMSGKGQENRFIIRYSNWEMKSVPGSTKIGINLANLLMCKEVRVNSLVRRVLVIQKFSRGEINVKSEQLGLFQCSSDPTDSDNMYVGGAGLINQ